jgi:hypothetical protein
MPAAIGQIENDQVKERSALGDALPVVTINQLAKFCGLEIEWSEAGQFLSKHVGDPGAVERTGRIECEQLDSTPRGRFTKLEKCSSRLSALLALCLGLLIK